MIDLSKFDKSKLEDYEILGVDAEGYVIQWDTGKNSKAKPGPYNCGLKTEEFEKQWWTMSDIERERCGLD